MKNLRFIRLGLVSQKFLNYGKYEIIILLLVISNIFFPMSTKAAIFSPEPSKPDAINRLREDELKSSIERLNRVISSDQMNQASMLAKKGIKRMKDGDRKLGLKDLELAWKMQPKLEAAGVVIGVIKLQENKYNEALKIAQKLQDNSPKQTAGYVLSGMAYDGLGDKKQAKAAFMKALKVRPGAPDASEFLAAYAIKENNVGFAVNLYKNSLSLNPENLQIKIKLAELTYREGYPEQAIAMLKEVIRKNKKNLYPRLLLARIYLAKSKSKEALAIAKPLVQQYPNNPEVLEVIGVAMFKEGNSLEAVRALKSALKISPNSVSTHYNLALVYFENENSKQQAIKEIKKVEQLDSNHAPTLFIKAKSLVNAGQLDAAQTILQKLAVEYSKDPDLKKLAIQLASAQMRKGEEEKSYLTLRNWLNQNPSDTVVRSMLAGLLQSNNLIKEAQAEYEEILRIQPESFKAMNNLAWLLMEKSEMEKSLEYARKAHEVSPKNTQVMDTLGVALLANSQTEDAVTILRQAVNKQTGSDPIIRFHLAQALVAVGRKDEAIKILEKLVQKEGRGNEQVQKLLAELKGN